MSQPRGFGLNGKSIYCNVAKPEEINIQFTVASGNGLGVTGVKSNGYVENVFMHTSTTPATGNGGFVNPNPAAGFVVVQLRNNFNYYLSNFWSVSPPTTGSALTSTTANVAYVVNALGTATAAQWQAKGLPVGLTPALGQAFVATATGTIGGSASVKVPSVSGVVALEQIGAPGTMLSLGNISQNAGAQVLMQFLGATSSSVTTLIPTAPADGSVVSMRLYYDGSSVSVDGI